MAARDQKQTAKTPFASHGLLQAVSGVLRQNKKTLESDEQRWKAPKSARNGLWQPAGGRFKRLSALSTAF
eukprot:8819980-Alexandrium_andersonii.AAC.1